MYNHTEISWKKLCGQKDKQNFFFVKTGLPINSAFIWDTKLHATRITSQFANRRVIQNFELILRNRQLLRLQSSLSLN